MRVIRKGSQRKGKSYILKRPFVVATFAMTVDGKVTTRNFTPVDFTSRKDKLHLFRQRALADAVVIGHTSLRRDNVRLGDTGSGVKQIQVALAAHGYKVSTDGVFGPQTSSAVKDFQKKNGLAPDGVVGPATWKKLQAASSSTSTTAAKSTTSTKTTTPAKTTTTTAER